MTIIAFPGHADVHCVPRPRRPLLDARSLALARSHLSRDITRPPLAAFCSPGGDVWPLARWRSLARIGDGADSVTTYRLVAR